MLNDPSKREINFKIVYCGPVNSGKTANLRYIFDHLDPNRRSELTSWDTKGEQTIRFDFLVSGIELPGGFKVRFHLYTVPGQFFYKASRRLVLRGADGIVYVADSSASRMESNLQILVEMVQTLRDYNNPIEDIPLVMQYNNRNAPDALPIEELEAKLNRWHAPYVEAIADEGVGVLYTLDLITKLVIKNIVYQVTLLSRPKATFRVNGNMSIVSVEGSPEGICGKKPEELIGQSFLTVFSEESRPFLEQAIKAMRGMRWISAKGAHTASGEVEFTIEQECSPDNVKIFKVTLRGG